MKDTNKNFELFQQYKDQIVEHAKQKSVDLKEHGKDKIHVIRFLINDKDRNVCYYVLHNYSTPYLVALGDPAQKQMRL